LQDIYRSSAEGSVIRQKLAGIDKAGWSGYANDLFGKTFEIDRDNPLHRTKIFGIDRD
jgi:hypothetical protein